MFIIVLRLFQNRKAVAALEGFSKKNLVHRSVEMKRLFPEYGYRDFASIEVRTISKRGTE